MEFFSGVMVAAVGWLAGWLIWYGKQDAKTADLARRVDRVEEAQRDDLTPRKEFELGHREICARLGRIESKLDRIGGKTE